MQGTVQATIEFQMVSATADTGFGLQSADNLDPSVSTAIQSWCVTYRSIEAQETSLDCAVSKYSLIAGVATLSE